MTLDTLTIRRAVVQVWKVDERGDPSELVSETNGGWTCAEHGGSWSGWQDAAIHCEAQHGDEAIPPPAGFADATGVGESVTMEIEAPNG